MPLARYAAGMPDIHTFTGALILTWGLSSMALLAGAAVLHAMPRLGAAGKRLAEWWCAGWPLDVLVTWFTVLPLFVGPIAGGWGGLLGAVLGQLTALLVWTLAHEIAHYRVWRRPRIVTATSRIAGTVPNLIAVFWTAWAVPLFWVVRVAEYFIYTPLTWTVKLPKYDSREWVNVSRHKFEGLVGHDRIWCLYCDWMTGIWSLGSEMLRNVESFWCPIRFSSTAKCENCRGDFPDIAGGWVAADAKIEDVAAALTARYGEHGEVLPRSWWGHPERKPVQVRVRIPRVSRSGEPMAREPAEVGTSEIS